VLQNEPPAARLVAQVRGRGRPGDRTATTSARSGSLRCGILGVTGTHSEAPPEGEFCALRLRVANPDPAFHTFVAARQRLAGVEPPRDAPSGFAMAVRRQHDQVELGGQNVLEVELWYDVPKGAPVSGVRLSGDSDPEGFQSDQTVAHAPDGVLVPLTPAR